MPDASDPAEIRSASSRPALEAGGYRLFFDREERALLDLARSGTPRAPTGDLSWDAVERMARLHRLEPRLHRAVQALEPGWSPPAAVAAAWRTAYFAYLHHNVTLLDRRDRAIRVLADGGIRPMAVKGAALAGTLYRDPAVRPMGDLDLLLPPGTTARFESLRPRLLDAAINFPYGFEVEEDHHDLTMDGIYRLDFDALWRGAVTAPFADGGAVIPCLEDQLLLAAVSCCRNSFWNPLTLLDAAELLHQHGARLDWSRAVARAAAWELDAALDTLLALVAALFGEEAPPEVRHRLAPRRWRRALIGNLLGGFRLHEGSGLESVNIPRPIGAFALKYAVSRPRVLARQVRAVMLPSRRWMREHYPRAGRAGILLRYAVHPFRLLSLAVRLARDGLVARRPRT